MEQKESFYRQAVREIESIVLRIERNEIDLEELIPEMKRAMYLLKECNERLFHTEQEIKKLMDSEDGIFTHEL